MFQVVAAIDDQRGIGNDDPWKVPEDLAHRNVTSDVSTPGNINAVIMGRKTWESIPPGFRPLKNRLNVVVSSCGGGLVGAAVAPSLEAALAEVAGAPNVENTFVIGLYEEALDDPRCTAVHLTVVKGSYGPELPQRFRLWTSVAKKHATFKCYVAEKAPPNAPSHEEHQYLDMIRDVLAEGNEKTDRTGTGTISAFGKTMRFNLREYFPLLTTKRVFWRGVAEELLWFVKGSTNAKLLKDKGIGIWDGNGSREYLDSIGLVDREENDLGPVYGFQWRHFGAEYTDMHADYTGKGIDQLAEVIHKIRTNPDDRRIVLSAWNPADLKKMALPPCHMFCQFYVADGELSCQMYQRSCDLGLGVPFNIASYALLTRLIAHVTGLRAGDLVHVLGDAHVYKNHVEPLQRQLLNEPRPFPVLKINKETDDIDSFEIEDLEIVGYSPHKKIHMEMAV